MAACDSITTASLLGGLLEGIDGALNKTTPSSHIELRLLTLGVEHRLVPSLKGFRLSL